MRHFALELSLLTTTLRSPKSAIGLPGGVARSAPTAPMEHHAFLELLFAEAVERARQAIVPLRDEASLDGQRRERVSSPYD